MNPSRQFTESSMFSLRHRYEYLHLSRLHPTWLVIFIDHILSVIVFCPS
jgi:hypothetical protein